MRCARNCRPLAAALLFGLCAALSACGHYGAPLRTLPPPPDSPPGTPQAAVPALPQKAVPPPNRTPSPLDEDNEGWTP